jgi:hypothetical protein
MAGAGHPFSTDQRASYRTTESLVERHSLAIKAIQNAIQGRDGQSWAS